MHSRMYRRWVLATGLAGAALSACAVDKTPDARHPVDSPLSGGARVAAPREPTRVDSSAALVTVPRSRSAKPPAPLGPRHVLVGDYDMTGVGYDRGSATAPVVLIDLSDFACPYCGEFSRETYPTIERDYVNTGKVFFKYVPFVVGSFPHSQEATRAAECDRSGGLLADDEARV